jgi:endonuclease/exonuclease/phosphatase family metal-dependent hydrolase
VISWNIQAGGGDRKPRLVDAVIARNPDVVTFQEVTPGSVESFRELFGMTELAHFTDSFPRCNAHKLTGCRRYGELVASRWPLEQIASTSFGAPWSEKVLSVDINSPQGRVELHSVHLPNGSANGWTKIEMFEAIYKKLARNVKHHRILCGDFNSPLHEMADGQIRTCGQDIRRSDGRYIIGGSWRDKQGRKFPSERWDMAERQVLQGLRRYDLSDVFRAKHPYGQEGFNSAKEFSYYTNNRGNRIGRRFDHIFASHLLEVIECGYLHDLRKVQKLSDHAPIEALFTLKALIRI